MYWFTSRDGTRFLAQTPLECARSLALAFPEPDVQVTPQRFMEQVKKECPLYESAGDREPADNRK